MKRRENPPFACEPYHYRDQLPPLAGAGTSSLSVEASEEGALSLCPSPDVWEEGVESPPLVLSAGSEGLGACVGEEAGISGFMSVALKGAFAGALLPAGLVAFVEDAGLEGAEGSSRGISITVEWREVLAEVTML